jgi:hypothetical protein
MTLRSLTTTAQRWWLPEAALGRIAAMRVIAYLFIPLDVFVFTPWIAQHADVPTVLYQPLRIGDLLHLPTPTHAVVLTVQWLLVGTSLLAATGRAPRVLGAAVFLLYGEWMVIAMSYGKVDHDRYAFLVLLAVLPTLGRARFGDRRPSAAAGWALRCVQIAVMLTYFLASLAKLRFGGWDWTTGATLSRAILRRGTVVSRWMLDYPHLLEVGQFLMVGAELLSPLILLAASDRARTLVAAALFSFHIATFAGITIIFLPHLIAVCSLLPLHRPPKEWLRPSPRPTAAPPVVALESGP